MATDGESSKRVAVRTYVPEYQRDEWDAHAEESDMSRSEFVRTMVQAGRRGFDEYESTEASAFPQERTNGHQDAPGPDSTDDSNAESREEQPSGGAGAGPTDSTDLEDRIVELLDDGCLSWDELFDALTENIEDRLESTLDALQAANRVRYSGREGGYVVVE